MSFEHVPAEPYVNGTIVREVFGGITAVTLGRWAEQGCPFRVGRNGRRMYRISEVERWFFPDQAPRTDSPADREHVA